MNLKLLLAAIAIVGLLAGASVRAAGIAGYPCYLTVDEMNAEMASIVADYPNLARMTNVGTSKLGEQINGIVLTSSSSPGPKYPVLLTAGVHPDELSPCTFLLVLAREACAAYATNGYSYRYILDYSEVHIIPCVGVDTRRLVDANGDGGPTSNVYRKNNGVNLNRNFPFTWGWGTNGVAWSDDPADLNYYGTGPASEPEVAAITNYYTKLWADRRGPTENDAAPSDTEGLFIDIHTQAQTINYWPGFTNATAPNETQLLSITRKGRAYTGYQINGATGNSSTAGTSHQDVYGNLGVPAFTWEFGVAGQVDCNNYASHVIPTNLPAFRFMLRLGGRRPYLEPKAPEVTSLVVNVVTNGATRELQISGTADDTKNDLNSDHDIDDVEYSISLPPWHSNALTNSATITKTATGKANFSATYDASSLSPGEYVLYASASDVSDTYNYGVTTATLFTIDGEPTEPPPPTSGSGILRAAPGALRGSASNWRMQ